MRMCRRLAAAFLTLLIAGVGQPQSVAWSEAAGHASPTEAYQAGLAALARGQAEQAVQALDYAAGKGLLDAQLKLAEPVKAFQRATPGRSATISALPPSSPTPGRIIRSRPKSRKPWWRSRAITAPG
jgi:hypothetical protein